METCEITAGRLHLRPFRPGDEPAVLDACVDEATRRWTTVPDPYTAEDARRFVGEHGPAGWASGEDLSFAVCDSTTGSVLAAVSLRGQDGHGGYDVGYWALPSARGRGVVPEALATLCRWAFAELGAQRVEWRAAVGNTASRRAAEKAGFTVEGTLRRGMVHRGRRVDSWVGSRLPGDPDGDTARD